MKLSLDEMATFVEVIDAGSFSAASESSGVPISTISRRISDLEKRLDVQRCQIYFSALSALKN